MEPLPKLIPLLFSFLLFPLATMADAPGGCTPHDRDVLLQVKAHFNGVGLLSDWDPKGDCCDWAFIGCPTEGPNYGRVTGLTISRGSGLVGTIPDVIGELTYLDEVMFEDEPKLIGPIPESFSKLTNLRIIYLGSNSLSGNIPSFLGKLEKLEQIDISHNHFTGSIPPTLSSLTALKAFDVSYNQLCGAIPKGLQKFKASSFEHNKCLCGPPLSRTCK